MRAVLLATLALLAIGCDQKQPTVDLGAKKDVVIPAQADTQTQKIADAGSGTEATGQTTTGKPLFTVAKSREEALRVAKGTGGYVVLKFGAEWCLPCKLMKREAFTDPSVAKLLEKAVLVDVDVDTPYGAKLAKEFHANTLPLLLFLKTDGKDVHGIVGYQDVPDLKKKIEQGLSKI